MSKSSDITPSLHLTGMESVVATVSGYHGSERFKLIKLISHAGGRYVGSMNQSTTHLICWKFEGRKYELAQKLKTVVVNHRWIEDCIKQGRRVSERSYALRCGKEMGSLLMDIPPVSPVPGKVSNSLGNQSSVFVNHFIDIDNEDAAADDAVWSDSILLKESLIPKMERRKKASKLKRRLVDKSTDQIHSSHATHHFNDPPLSCYYNKEHEELDSSSKRRLRKKKSSSSIEPMQKGRRLVRKNIISDVPGSETEEECNPVHANLWQNDITDVSNNSSHWNPAASFNDDIEDVKEINNPYVPSFANSIAPEGASTSLVNASDQSATPKYSSKTKPFLRLAKSNDFSDGASTLVLNASDQSATPEHSKETEPVIRLAKSTLLSNEASTLLHDGLPDQLATPKDSSETPITILNKSTDLSCVICWTDFSSTRGVLPCGHRFCFPCIQNWADHMSSSRKTSTCPLCKASFDNITKVDDAVSSDQKVYSQTIPHDSSVNIYVLPNCEASILRNHMSASPVCSRCCSREPEDLLIRCHLCQTRCVHSYCLDPYILPWTCTHCKDLRMFYHHT